MSGAQVQKRAAAFFDIDGTLVGEPPLENRLFHELRRRGAIPWMNYARWGMEALRLMPGGLVAVTQGNKRYLRGLRVEEVLDAVEPVAFFEEGVARAEWHAKRGDAIVLVTGMIKPLARVTAMALECELEARGVEQEVFVSATRLDESGGIFTGRVLGEANFGEAKRRAIGAFARAMRIDLRESHAYGNTLRDRPMLEGVGRAHAVNPGREFAKLANLCDWPIWHWHQVKKCGGEDSLKEKVRLKTTGTHS